MSNQIPKSDEELMDEVKCDKNVEAFEELVKRHTRRLVRLLNLWGAAYAADDVVQEAFLRLWNKREHYDTARSFRPWIDRIAYNAFIDWFRTECKHRKAESLTEQLDKKTDDPDIGLIQAEWRVQVMVCLSKHPDDEQEIILLKYFEEVSDWDIANHLKTSEGSVRNKRYRALVKLRKCMLETFPER